MIDAYASQPNYWRHLAPIVAELERRGHEIARWSGPDRPREWGPSLKRRRVRAPLVLVAAGIDAKRLASQRAVYVEHGAGQTYLGEDGYAGMRGLEHVALFVGPGEHVSARWRTAYPHAAVEAVGCPALDRHLQSALGWATRQAAGLDTRPLVALTSHWRCHRLNESMPALPHFARGLAELARLDSIELVGHAHPRGQHEGTARWADLEIRYEPDPDRILELADLLIADNTSLMYEAAALGIPVLALNGPRYRREVEHGLRFWSHVPGIQCDTVRTFVPAVIAALDDPPEARALRDRAARHVYAHRDGLSAARAADAVERLL